MDWDDAYANSPYIAGAADYAPRWKERAAAYRAAHANAEIGLAYGAHPRQRLDIFRPEGTPRGLALFVHGGYWLAFDGSNWSHLAEGARQRGWAVVLPTYVLAPEARISDITAQITQALTFAADRISGSIRLAGHSAGGHLVTRTISDDSALGDGVASRIEKVVSISGLHDLRPLLNTKMNDTLRLTETEALSESAAFHLPRAGVAVTAWVGADERPEFLRQSRLLVDAWRRHGTEVKLVVEPDRHHFDVIDGLADPENALAREFAE